MTYKSTFNNVYLKMKTGDSGFGNEIEGLRPVFRFEMDMPEGLCEVRLEDYAIIPLKEYQRLRAPWWQKILRLLRRESST